MQVTNIQTTSFTQNPAAGQAPRYLEIISKPLRKVAPFIEEHVVKKHMVEDLINIGNISKELVCMVVYPLQVLTNPDLPKDQRRFVGLYDFFVTCFSLGGTILYALKGKKMAREFAKFAMKKYTNNTHIYPHARRAVEGGAFVVGIAVQTILFKRMLAPAFSPPLAAKARTILEERDAKKGQKTQKSQDRDIIPAKYDAALAKAEKNTKEKQTKLADNAQDTNKNS